MKKHRNWHLGLLVLSLLSEISQISTTVVQDESIMPSQDSASSDPLQASSSSFTSSSSSSSSHAMSTMSSSSSSSIESKGKPSVDPNHQSHIDLEIMETLQQHMGAASDLTNPHLTHGIESSDKSQINPSNGAKSPTNLHHQSEQDLQESINFQHHTIPGTDGNLQDHSHQGSELLDSTNNNFNLNDGRISHVSKTSLKEQTTDQSLQLEPEETLTTLGPMVIDEPMVFATTNRSPSLPLPTKISKIPQTTASSQKFPSASVKEFYNLTKEYFRWKLKEFPQQTTHIGVNDASNGHLDRFSPVHFERRRLACEDFLKRGQAIDTSTFSEEDMLNYDIYVYDINTYLQNYKYLKFFTPINFLEGPQNNLKYTLKATTLKTYNDYLKLISRISEFPRQADEIINIMNGSISSGLMPSKWSLNGVISQFDSLLVPYNESAFYQPFLDIHLNISDEQKKVLKRLAIRPVKRMISAFKRIRDFIETDYYPATRPIEGVSSLPDGKEFYQACLKFHTSTDLTPQQIHELGLAEVKRIQREVSQTAIELGMPNKTLTEINEIVQQDPTQRFETKEDLLHTYRKAVYNDIYPRMNLIVNEVPDVNVSVEENVAGASYASYSNPPIDNSRPGTFFINAKIFRSHKRYEVNALSLHETVPGHHLQSVNLMLNPSVPDFRKFPDFYRYGDIPARFPMHTAFTEGWGLYSEYLGYEMGLYRDPYQRYGRHSFELLRSCRLVVDTGIHALGWTRQQAIDYLLQNTAMTEEPVKIQIDRYISWPGQACAYKVGEIKIMELRKRAEDSLGPLFKLQDFHDVVLGCVGPLSILQGCVEKYILKLLHSTQQL